MSYDFIRKATSAILGKEEDETEILPIDRFFPSIDYDDDESLKKRFYIKTSYRDELYIRYCNDLDFRIALNKFLVKKQTVNNRVKRVMRDAIHQKEAIVLEINGHIGSGKSALIQGNIIPLYAILQERNVRVFCDIGDLKNYHDWIINPKFTKPVMKVYVTYSNSETNEIIGDGIFKPGDFIFQDEMPVEHGKGSKTTVDNLGNIIRMAARKNQINIAFISPEFIEMNQVDYYLTILAINKTKKLTVALISTKSGHIGVIGFKLNLDEKLIEYYEVTSAKRKKEIQDQAGFAGVKLTETKMNKLMDDLMKKVIATAKKEHVGQFLKGYIRGVARTTSLANEIFYEEVVSRVHARLKSLSPNHFNDDGTMVANAAMAASNAVASTQPEKDLLDEYFGDKLEKKKSIQSKSFKIDVVKILNGMVNDVNNHLDPVKAKMFLDSINPTIRQEDLALKYKVSQSEITVNKRRLGERIAKIAGRLYEQHQKEYYESDDNIIKVEHQTARGKPDLVVYYKNGNIDVFSLKCYSKDPNTRKSDSISRKDIAPEIIAANRLHEQNPSITVTCFLKYYNALTGKTYMIPIDYENPEDTYLIPIKQ